MTSKRIALAVVFTLGTTLLLGAATRREGWSPDQVEALQELSLARLDPLPADPTNRVADDPRAAQLGQRLFFDARFSANGKVSCATCHQPEREFQDGTRRAAGIGTTNRRTMPVAGTAYAPFLFWDGRKDSLWAQALGPLESAVEHGGTRAQYAHIVAEHYRTDYERLFGRLPNLTDVPRAAGPVADPAAARAWTALSPARQVEVTAIYVNIGKAIAAYERRLQFAPSRFDRYVAGINANGRAPEGVLSADEVAGLRLFIGKANCLQCHNGPLFTNNEFHNTGVPADPTLPPDRGRFAGATDVLHDEFNCRSRWSDAPAQCPELAVLATAAPEQERAFKVPSLRNVAVRGPYMHAGQLVTLADVLDHYNRAPQAPSGHSELNPLRLVPRELRQIEAFLRTLSGDTQVSPELLAAPAAR